LDRPVTTRGRTVSEADMVTFAGISGDWNPLHIDEEFSSPMLVSSAEADAPR
jgi:acyl dehydratase